jgi:hypothetical protein
MQLYETYRVVMINLHLLKLKTLSDEMDYIILYSCPKENLFHVFIHFLHTRMHIVKHSMEFLEYNASNIPTLRDVLPSLVS